MKSQKEKTVTIKIELDTTDVQEKLDEIDKQIRNSDAFNGLSNISTLPPQNTAGGVYTAQLGINLNGVTHHSGFAADRFELHSGIDTNIEDLIENAVKNHVQSAVQDIKKQLTADWMIMTDLTSHIKQVMLLECFPDGILHRNFGRR
ncbi:hypothetical protein HCH73_08065 [Citrobacter koseri]|uniref:hypothetical protein n=1 Tax=Citrobacter koseri TaxID=545 RepID=UPI0018E1B4B1|nr:hypothetical protein [Citrobacter koseri]MBI0676989.1 hypothetical protein [Citrobacter koseri]